MQMRMDVETNLANRGGGRTSRALLAASLVIMAAGAAIGCGTTSAQAPQPAGTRAAHDPGGAPLVASDPMATGPAAPVAVNCGAGSQALIRSTVINGQAVSQVDCVSIPGHDLVAASVPGQPAMASTVRYVPVGDVETLPVERPTYREGGRPASYRTAEYSPERQEVTRGRSWQKSAIIIGSSAGVGAGVGAAVGGKKGALIGAAVGGGSATIWDQVTRRRS
jgi:hypothetical protein